MTRREFPVLGHSRALKGLMVKHGATTIILASSGVTDGGQLQTMMDCLELGIEIVPMPMLYERLTGRVAIEQVGGNLYVGIPIHHPGTQPLSRTTKRMMDVVLAAMGLIFLALLAPFITLALYLDSRGPIIYSQVRVGLGGRPYRMHKFRSMVSDAERGGAMWARENDSRATRVGRFLRRTHLDELPQFVNILKGEMSVVGPRPERPEFVETLAKEIPFYRVRHAVKPGTAGWGLIRHGYGASKADALTKLQYDLYYIKHQSLWLDAIVILKTAAIMLRLRGR